MPDAYLEVHIAGVKKSWPITGDVSFVGRGDDCTIVVPDVRLSRRHFKIVKRPDSYWVEDLGSLNGTHVESVRVQGSAQLSHGMKIAAGQTEFVFTLSAAASRLCSPPTWA